MAYTKLSPLLAILLSSKYVDAAMIRAPTPAVTPAPAATAAPLAVRDITTIGYISTGMYGSTTLCKKSHPNRAFVDTNTVQMKPSRRTMRVMSLQHQVVFTRSAPRSHFASSFLAKMIMQCFPPRVSSGTMLHLQLLCTDD
jgi:hypothetical protein